MSRKQDFCFKKNYILVFGGQGKAGDLHAIEQGHKQRKHWHSEKVIKLHNKNESQQLEWP